MHYQYPIIAKSNLKMSLLNNIHVIILIASLRQDFIYCLIYFLSSWHNTFMVSFYSTAFSDRYWYWVKNLWVKKKIYGFFFSENSRLYFEKNINFSAKEATGLCSC